MYRKLNISLLSLYVNITIYIRVITIYIKVRKDKYKTNITMNYLVIVFQLLGICYLIIRVQQLRSINLLQGLIINCINI